MRKLRLTIQYDGTAFHGWQVQPGLATVQQAVQDALTIILQHPVVLHGSGRTDTGVHALGQVAHFATDRGLAPPRVMAALNSILPGSVRIVDVQPVDAGFHARYDARSRTYWYCIWNAPVVSPFWRAYVWHIRRPLDVAAMRRAAALLIGTHDFTSFQGADREEVQPVRSVMRIGCSCRGPQLQVWHIEASSFLKHMVRNIVGTLVEVGRGAMDVDDFGAVLAARDRCCAGPAAPPQGLFLRRVRY